MGDGNAQTDRGDLKGTTHEFFVLAMSILSIVNLGLMAIFDWGSQPWLLVAFVDIALTIVFVFDFAYRLKTSPARNHYFVRGGGILDLLSCVPGAHFRAGHAHGRRRALRDVLRVPRERVPLAEEESAGAREHRSDRGAPGSARAAGTGVRAHLEQIESRA